MATRRRFLGAVAGGLGLTAVGAAPKRPRPARRAPFGLQLYSVRRGLPKDVPGTLAKVKAIGFTDAETAGFHGLTAPAFAAELRKAGLACRSGHFDYERFRDDAAAVVRDGDTLVAGGADPAALIEKLGRRVPLTHLKDMAKGTQYTPPTTEIPESANVVRGTGTLDIPAILRASDRAGVEYQFLEDEHVDALAHLPKSLAYLKLQG